MMMRAALPRLGLAFGLAAMVAWALLHRPVLDATNPRHQIQSVGSWAELRRDFIAFHDGFLTELGIHVPREYLLTIGVRR
jgi:hypothetical protein